eukprot:gnl/Spiro4/27244_TR13546_c0_g1_i1.p2 gnl/Spiro4/27244_TR13546_c0_g1~~gnl/Spiro4/27244_TR13546_c0_g1_i1.p2  ORF type:complete len:209 (+),score=53.98 gnl/Spiro4/27244_TR13546_c0_g1_i1:41-667(+)
MKQQRGINCTTKNFAIAMAVVFVIELGLTAGFLAWFLPPYEDYKHYQETTCVVLSHKFTEDKCDWFCGAVVGNEEIICLQTTYVLDVSVTYNDTWGDGGTPHAHNATYRVMFDGGASANPECYFQSELWTTGNEYGTGTTHTCYAAPSGHFWAEYPPHFPTTPVIVMPVLLGVCVLAQMVILLAYCCDKPVNQLQEQTNGYQELQTPP